MDSNGKLKNIVNRDIEINNTVYNFVGDIEYLIKEHYIVNKELRKRLYEIADNLDKELEKLQKDIKFNLDQYEQEKTSLIQFKINELQSVISTFNEIKVSMEEFKEGIAEEMVSQFNSQYLQIDNTLKINTNENKKQLTSLITEKVNELTSTVNQEIGTLKSLKKELEVLKLNSETKFFTLNQLEEVVVEKLIELANILNTLNEKADKSTSIKSLRVDNNILFYSTHTNQEYSIFLPIPSSAMDTKQGIISKNEIKDMFNVYTIDRFIQDFKTL